MRGGFATAIVVTGLLTGGSAQTPAPTIDDLAWLSGCWAMPRPDGLTEEHWMRPAGGTMLGMNRTVRGGRTVEYEFLQILEVMGRLAFLARPSGQAPATFPLASLGERDVVFENRDHDFPQRIIYRLDEDGTLSARVEGTVDGETRGVDFPYRRCEPAAQPASTISDIAASAPTAGGSAKSPPSSN
jgi:hypothetical protein